MSAQQNIFSTYQRRPMIDLNKLSKEELIKEGLNTLSKLCRAEADKWYHSPSTGELLFLNHGERFALIHSEISEAMESHRKDLMDDKLPHRKGVEVELADALIRIFDYAGDNKL